MTSDDRDVVEIPLRAGEDHDHLLLDRDRRVERLLEQLDQPVAALELGLRHGVELGAERGERLELAELGEVELQRAGHRLHRLDLGGAADSGHRVAHVDGGTHAGLEQVVLHEHLTVGDRDHVGRDVRRDVTGLGLDDRQRGERTRTVLVGQLGGALEQAAVQVEHVAGIGLAARRAAQQQRHLAVCLGLLRQVVVDDERVLAVLHPVLAHGAAGVRGEILERCRVGGGGRDDDGVLHRPGLAQRLNGLGDRRSLLADRDVDALHALAALVEDRVDRDRRLAGLAVADDQLTLAAPDRGHRVDRLDARLERLVDRLATGDAGSLDLHPAGLHTGEVAQAVDRLTEGVDDATEHAVADRHRENATRRLDGLAFLDRVDVAEHDGADRLLVEVEREADAAVLELEQLVHAAIGEARNAGDAVADLGDAADRAGLQRRREAFEVLTKRGRDVCGGDGQFSHGGVSPSLRSPATQAAVQCCDDRAGITAGSSTGRDGCGRCRR